MKANNEMEEAYLASLPNDECRESHRAYLTEMRAAWAEYYAVEKPAAQKRIERVNAAAAKDDEVLVRYGAR